MKLFFDTETTGLPIDYNAPITDLKNWPRIVQIAWALYDDDGNLVDEFEYIIQPKGFKIPKKATEIHGISHDLAKVVGKDLSEVLFEFVKYTKDADLLVAHNFGFDEKIILAEFMRKKLSNPFEGKNKFCTMKAGVDICKIPRTKNQFKFPTLSELHNKLFGVDFVGKHSALSDIRLVQSHISKG